MSDACLIASSDGAEKLAKIVALGDAIQRAKDALRKEPTWENALALQQLQQQRRELMSLLPKPKLVVNNVSR